MLDAHATLFVALFVGTFVSEDAACLFAGGLVAAGEISFPVAVVACMTGIFAGDAALYGIGRLIGPGVFRTRLGQRLVSSEKLGRAYRWLDSNIGTAVITSRFVSGLRLPMYLAAGAVKADARKFLTWFLIAALIWTPLVVGTTAFSIGFLSPGNLVLGVLGAVVIFRVVRSFTTWKKRRLLIGKIKRITNWEFWPLPVFYAPVVLYIGWLGLRSRSLMLFTAANPGMPGGGFVGESKDEIYGSMHASTEHLLRHVKIARSQSLEQRVLSVVRFLVKNKLTYPLVVKPDVGERGRDVKRINNRDELAMAIKSSERDLILQEYCDGVEASVFYNRMPGEETGEIFSITEKAFPFATGDGHSTLEELILSDRRAVCMAASYFKQHPGQIDRVPAKGEQVKLIDIGTHSRGAIFLDGERLKTIQLEHTIDKISRRIDGFYFGRFDIRSESFEDLASGRFKIIELNGVTSESTNIYDPRYSLIDAYRTLFRQWRIAFEIGAENRRCGFEPISLSEFVKLIITRDATQLSITSSGKLPANQPTSSCA